MKHFLTYSFSILIVLTILFGADRILNAQTLDGSYDPVSSGDIVQQISAVVTPDNPIPGQAITISLSAYGTDLNNATISWSVNGSFIQKGVGLTQFNLTAGKNGEVKKVVATISPETGPTLTKSFSISAQDVSIIYESDSYVPPFYKGKGLYGTEGTVTLVAMPNLISPSGTHLNPNSLTYKWIVDGTVQGSMSGYGKNSFIYTGSILGKDALVEVDVSSADGSVSGKGNILLSVQQPEALLYEKNPLYGIMFNKELSANGFNLTDKEATIAAIPFSTSASSANDSSLQYKWTLNGDPIPAPQDQNYATFRNSTGEQGSSLVGVTIANTSHLLQQMGNSLSITF